MAQTSVLQGHEQLVNAVQEVAQSIRTASQPKRRRDHIGKSLLSLGNLAISALVFGEAFGGFDFDVQTAVIGVLTFVALYIVGLSLMERRS